MTNEPSASLEFEQKFVVIPQWILFKGARPEPSGLSDRAIRLYGVLQSYADNETRRSFPARRTLAKALACSVKSIDRALDELVKFGAVAKIKRRDDAGDWTSNEYIVRAIPEENLWSLVTRGSDTGDATVETPATLRVATAVSPKLDPTELDPTNSAAQQKLLNISIRLIAQWSAITGTPLTRAVRKKWIPQAHGFVTALTDQSILDESGSFLSFAFKEGCNSPGGWPHFVAAYTRQRTSSGVSPELAAAARETIERIRSGDA
jgi:hypothetical protein